jgi:hypothetical protein
MATITVVSVIGAALVSITGTSIQSQLKTGNAMRAFYLAESGLRMARSQPRPGPFFTVWTGEDGRLRMAEDPPPPAAPTPIPTLGFRIARNRCKLESVGVVRSDSIFESARRLAVPFFNGMPCWRFEAPPADGGVPDDCGENQGRLHGAGWEWRRCDGRTGGTLFLGGAVHMETDFAPFCEIGDGAAFAISFWARPADAGGGIALGVADGVNRFSVGIDGAGDWFWAYGNRTGGGIPAEPGIWQRVRVAHDPAIGEVRLQVVSCPSGPREERTPYDGSAVIPEPALWAGLFVGAENRNGNPGGFFRGDIDDVDIRNEAVPPDPLQLVCPGAAAVAHYPLDRDTADHGGPLASGNGHDAAAFGGTLAAPDRWACPEGALALSGAGEHLRVDDDDDLDLRTGGTVAAWVAPSSLASEAVLLQKGATGTPAGPAYLLQFGGAEPSIPPRHLRFSVADSMGTIFRVDAGRPMAIDEWGHVAATWDVASGDLILYLNGAEEARASLESSTPLQDVAGPLFFGAGETDAGDVRDPFHGRLDDILLYDTPLTADAIAALAADAPEGTP